MHKVAARKALRTEAVMKKYDICIVGAGPAGIFTAIELLRNGSDKKIVIVEKGQPVERRKCPKANGGPCRNCKPYCHISRWPSGLRKTNKSVNSLVH